MEAAKAPAGGEIRKLHIIYFLSRLGGRIEHPHLIRVHHLARNGVYLRDVKRWLGELRGKDLPEAFSWSYKRRYKTGYVWQDLLDDDLITPISDNEYVLKGSQINPTPLESGSLCVVDKKASMPKLQQCLTEEPKILAYPDSAVDTPRKVSSEISQKSDRSTLTDEYDCSTKFEGDKVDDDKQDPEEQSFERLTEDYTLPPSLPQILLNKKSRKQGTEDEIMIMNNNKTDTPDDSSFSTSSSSSSSSKFSFDNKCRSNSSRRPFMFRNLITCGNSDVNDAVLVMLNEKGTNKSNGELSSEICKADKLGGSARGFADSWSKEKHQQYGARRSYDGGETNKSKKKPDEFMNQNHPKPFGGPTCSQCGKKFRPEKMHMHMKTCRGMKSLSKSAEKTTAPARSSTSANTDSTNFLVFKT